MDNWESFFIHEGKQLGEPPGCEIPTDPNAEGVLGGLLDASVSHGYAVYLFTENAMIQRDDTGLPRIESNGIFVRGAYLNYEPDPTCIIPVSAVETRFSTYIPPRGSSTIGLWALVINDAIAAAVQGCPNQRMTTVVTIQLFGQTQSGIDVITQPFDFPITICWGCLVRCPVGMTCAANPLRPWGFECDCDADLDTAESPCHLGQDFDIDCRLLPPCT
jgi:hypothetical protein